MLKKEKIKNNKEIKPLRDITGQRFGNLEVLRMEITEKSHGNEWRVICKCHLCGREDYEAKAAWVKDGKHSSHTKSCGCNKKYFENQTGKNSYKFKGHEEMGGVFLSNAKRRAKKKKLIFDLDIKFLWDLYINQNRKCALSGIDLVFPKSSNCTKSGNISLDRISSSLGYTKDNVQWVCKDVNLMKMYLDQKVFLDLCEKISINCRGMKWKENQ